MTLLLSILALLATSLSPAAETVVNEPVDSARLGVVAGSLESNTISYFKDPVLGVTDRDWGSNNYFKVGWRKDNLSAGLQAEWYPRALAGYPQELKGAGLTGLWVNWSNDRFDLTAGSFHEQFGSGIAFRSWEDRDLGINNAVTGLRASMHSRALDITVLGGVPKYGLSPADNCFIGGADLSLDVLAWRESAHSVRLEASFLDRIGRTDDVVIRTLAQFGGFLIPRQVVTWSGRLMYSWQNLSMRGEYVSKSDDFHAEQMPKSSERYVLKGGNAQLLEVNYSAGRFSGTAAFRRVENMASPMFLSSGTVSVANTLNYIPSLCMAQSYRLASLNPYSTFADGEAGAQGDLYYTFRGMKLHVGGSWIEGLPCALPDREAPHLAYREINIDLERRWTRNFRTVFFVSIQENSPTHGNRKATDAQNVFVLDGLYRLSRTSSIRLELQYLYSQELTRDWVAALCELSFAPRWSFTVSDMYNHGSSGIHYYNIGASYSLSSLSLSLLAGRNREGLICSGGICRWQPAWSGVGMRLQWSF